MDYILTLRVGDYQSNDGHVAQFRFNRETYEISFGSTAADLPPRRSNSNEKVKLMLFCAFFPPETERERQKFIECARKCGGAKFLNSNNGRVHGCRKTMLEIAARRGNTTAVMCLVEDCGADPMFGMCAAWSTFAFAPDIMQYLCDSVGEEKKIQFLHKIAGGSDSMTPGENALFLCLMVVSPGCGKILFDSKIDPFQRSQNGGIDVFDDAKRMKKEIAEGTGPLDGKLPLRKKFWAGLERYGLAFKMKIDLSVPLIDQKLCEVCLKKAAPKCGGCKRVRYCSADHQKKDWKQHKETCKKATK